MDEERIGTLGAVHRSVVGVLLLVAACSTGPAAPPILSTELVCAEQFCTSVPNGLLDARSARCPARQTAHGTQEAPGGMSADQGMDHAAPARARAGVLPTQIEAELATFEGCSQQVPPQFSAKKVAGERMYKRARRGETVQLPAVDVEILEIRLIDYSPPDIDFTMTCSSGTYVRAVVRDLGDRLGGGAHLTALRRTEVGSFSVDRAVPGIGLREGLSPDATHWVEPAAAVGHLTTIRVDADAAQRLRQGGAVPWKGEGGPEMRDSAMRDSAVRDSAVGDPEMDDPIAVIDEMGLVGIAEIRNGLLAPKKILATAAEG